MHPLPRLAALVTAASLVLVAAPVTAQASAGGRAHRCTPTVRALPDLNDGTDTTQLAWVAAVNRHHVYAGVVLEPWSDGRAAFWDAAGLHVIPNPALGNNTASDINDHGAVVGAGAAVDTEAPRSWVLEHGTVHPLAGLDGGLSAIGLRLNNRGTVVGKAPGSDARWSDPVRWRSWRSAPEVLPSLRPDQGGEALDINDRGTVVGRLVDSEAPGYEPFLGAEQAVRWDRRGRVRALPTNPSAGLVAGTATAVNNRGQVTGALGAADPQARPVAVRWSGRRITRIGTVRGDATSVGRDIASNGWVVGTSTGQRPGGGGYRHAFFWPGRGPALALPPLSGDWATTTTEAYGVAADGTVVGMSADGTGALRATVWTCAQRQGFVPPTPDQARAGRG